MINLSFAHHRLTRLLACLIVCISASFFVAACGGGGGGGGGGSSGSVANLEDPPLLFATVNIPYTYPVVATGSPLPDIRIENLPDWLLYEDGVISGTPTTADLGTSDVVKLHVFNGVTRDVIHFFQIVVDPDTGSSAAPSINSNPNSTARSGEEYRYVMSGSGNPRPTFSAKGLPAWLTVDGGTMFGTPPEEAVGKRYPIQVRARNGIDPMATQNYTLEVVQGNVPDSAELRVLMPTPIGELEAGNDTSVTVTISLGVAAANTVTVDYATADGTATAGLDYTAVTGSLTFTPGELTKQIMIPILGDDLAEGNESFRLELSNAVGAPIGIAFGQVTIADDDVTPGVPDFSVYAPTSDFEGNVGTSVVTFNIELSSASTSAVTVNYATSDGSAIAGSDYTATSGSLNFAAGELLKTVDVTILSDTTVESDESFDMSLSLPNGATIVTGVATYTILEDDSAMNVLATGTGQQGAQSNGTTNDQLTPNYVENASMNILAGASEVAMGQYFGLALVAGEVWAWGANDFGQTGGGIAGDVLRATRVVDSTMTPISNITQIAAGQRHGMALTSGGMVYAWGDNTNGQLGNTSVATFTLTAVMVEETPGTPLMSISSIAAGGFHSAAVRNDSSALAWGDNSAGQLAAASTNMSEASPVAMVDGLGATVMGIDSIDCGQAHTLVVLASSALLSAGSNVDGQLGDNTMNDRDHLAAVLDGALQPLMNVALCSAGDSSSYAILSSGALFAWGLNGDGQLGDASMVTRLIPVAVRDFNSTPLTNVSSISAGSHHAVALMSNGEFVAWGKNDLGALGSGTTTSSTVARAVKNGGGGNLRGLAAAAGTDATVLIQ